jgi:hypothetical protein
MQSFIHITKMDDMTFSRKGEYKLKLLKSKKSKVWNYIELDEGDVNLFAIKKMRFCTN